MTSLQRNYVVLDNEDTTVAKSEKHSGRMRWKLKLNIIADTTSTMA